MITKIKLSAEARLELALLKSGRKGGSENAELIMYGLVFPDSFNLTEKGMAFDAYKESETSISKKLTESGVKKKKGKLRVYKEDSETLDISISTKKSVVWDYLLTRSTEAIAYKYDMSEELVKKILKIVKL